MMTKDRSGPPRSKPRIGRLDKLTDVRRELAACYRAARTGSISPQDGARLASILTALVRVMELADVERRLNDLEDRHRDGTWPPSANGAGSYSPFTQ